LGKASSSKNQISKNQTGVGILQFSSGIDFKKLKIGNKIPSERRLDFDY